jgi:hypothetical protein
MPTEADDLVVCHGNAAAGRNRNYRPVGHLQLQIARHVDGIAHLHRFAGPQHMTVIST